MFASENSDANFSFAGNLTNLFAQNNQIQRLPIEDFSNIAHMKSIDVQNNLIESLDPNFIKNLDSGLRLYIAGNLKI